MFKHWFSRLRGPVLYLVVVGLLAAGAYNAAQLFRNSLESYQPLEINVAPAQSLTQLEGEVKSSSSTGGTAKPGVTAPLTNRVVVVLVNGLSLEDVEQLPALQNEAFRLISTGAYLFTGPVQPTTPALVTLLTGTGTELSGGLNFDPANATPPPVDELGIAMPGSAPTARQQLAQFDSVFAAVRRNKFTTALFGTNDWYKALPPDSLDYYTTFDVRQPAADVADNALNFLKKKSANLTLIQLSALAQTQRDFGASAPATQQARQSLNTALGRLIGSEIDLPQTTVIITGDWSKSVRVGDRWTVPLLMAGQAVQPGEKIWGRQEDVASTIAALLGAEMPRHNQGRILSSLLSMPTIDQGEKFLALAEQRLALATAYRLRLNLTLPLALNDPLAVEAEKNLKAALQNYRLGSYEGIEGVVDAILRYTRADMEEARQEWFAQVRWQRALLSVVLLALPLLLLLIWRSTLAMLAAVAAGFASALPYGLYLLQGQAFAFNSTTLSALLEDSLWRAGVALLVSLLIPLLFFDWAERRRRRISGRVDLEYQQIADLRRTPFPLGRLFSCCGLILGWLVYFSAVGWLVWYYWRFGYFAPLMGQPALLPDYNASFMQFFALYHLLGFMLAMLPAPLVLIGLYGLKRRVRGENRVEEEEQDILKKTRSGTPPERSIVKIS